MHGARWMLEISGGHFVKYNCLNHCAVHLKIIQNIECKLHLENKKEKENGIVI